MATERRHEITWHDPAPFLTRMVGMSGAEFLAASMSGEVPPPPIHAVIGSGILAFGDGEATISYEPAEYHGNGVGGVHGGVIAGLLDMAAALSIAAGLPAGAFSLTLELSVRYVRVVTLGSGRFQCKGRVIHLGKRTGVAQAELLDSSARLHAHGTATYLLTFPDHEG
jgi:uncharacterized protein (TIGR00369 family)